MNVVDARMKDSGMTWSLSAANGCSGFVHP